MDFIWEAEATPAPAPTWPLAIPELLKFRQSHHPTSSYSPGASGLPDHHHLLDHHLNQNRTPKTFFSSCEWWCVIHYCLQMTWDSLSLPTYIFHAPCTKRQREHSVLDCSLIELPTWLRWLVRKKEWLWPGIEPFNERERKKNPDLNLFS